ncbi:MAG: 2-oxoglutarate oxidoreductase subunit KorB [Phycisphaerae bacterium]|nr:2-oxoglutarate oxidoreductase subunit KorB [Phycisphaerae bacterium]
MSAPMNLPTLTAKDFASDQEVRWCPGCGDYSILAQVKKILPTLGIPKEKFLFVSGIGCSSRFPYYMNTYGMHSIHGRALAIATGAKVANPDLKVWVVTGDGDGLSIGGNHLLHAIRRNVEMVILLFDNRIYGLTKGQYSPTSVHGQKTKTSPLGVVDYPIHPLSVAIAAEATFVARTVDVDVKHLGEVLSAAARHQGTAFVQIYQNCVIFNDNAFEYASDKSIKSDNIVYLEHGKPLIFGKNSDKGIRMNGTHPEVVQLGNGVDASQLLVHDETLGDSSVAFMLSRMSHPEFPEPMGIFRQVVRPTFEGQMTDQLAKARKIWGEANMDLLIQGTETWTVN